MVGFFFFFWEKQNLKNKKTKSETRFQFGIKICVTCQCTRYLNPYMIPQLIWTVVQSG
jgi:hypothetical protein